MLYLQEQKQVFDKVDGLSVKMKLVWKINEIFNLLQIFGHISQTTKSRCSFLKILIKLPLVLKLQCLHSQSHHLKVKKSRTRISSIFVFKAKMR